MIILKNVLYSEKKKKRKAIKKKLTPLDAQYLQELQGDLERDKQVADATAFNTKFGAGLAGAGLGAMVGNVATKKSLAGTAIGAGLGAAGGYYAVRGSANRKKDRDIEEAIKREADKRGLYVSSSPSDRAEVRRIRQDEKDRAIQALQLQAQQRIADEMRRARLERRYDNSKK